MERLVRERIKLEKLKGTEKARLYKEKAWDVCPGEHQEMRDIKEEWVNMKDKITQILKDVLETKKIIGVRKNKTIWWTDEVRESVK